ncbi:MAG: hypothetical protein WCT32_04130 [Patescibacteria group bacterium]|jgi:hypothetical protein
MDKDLMFESVQAEAESDPNIIGFILVAGRGKGFSTEHSDYDVIIVVNDGREIEYREKYSGFTDTSDVYIKVLSLAEFRDYANWGSGFEWDRYNFTHLKAQIDKAGEIQKLIEEKGKLPEEKIKEVVSGNLDAYINSFHRSMKNCRDNNAIASLLDAAESVPLLLVALFALEGRVKPYNKYLEWELKNYPLVNLVWGSEEFIGKLRAVVCMGDVEVQKEVFNKVKDIFRKKGFDDIINGWNSYYMG